MDREILFKTRHGSHLYGLNHADSDEDFYTVVSKKPIPAGKQVKARYAKQSIVGSEDSMVVDIGTWLGYCAHGVPQALEAMFAGPEHVSVDAIAGIRSGYFATQEVTDTYLRTIKSFCYSQDQKKKRHGIRLAFNLSDILAAGRFNPTLTDNQIDYATDVAHKDSDSVYAKAMVIALDREPPNFRR